jgi:amino acid permease
MASSGLDYNEKTPPHFADSTPIARGVHKHDDYDVERPKQRKQSVVASLKNAYGFSDTNRLPSADGSIKQYDATHRKLKPRHIQLIGIGGTIGTALYVQIGQGLLRGGPASLFIAFTLW